MHAGTIARVRLVHKVEGKQATERARPIRSAATDHLIIRLVLVLGLLAVGLGIATDIGTYSSGALPIRWVEIPVFPNTPAVTALTRHGTVSEGLNYDVTLATPEFFESVHRADDIIATGAYLSVVFVLVEYHYHDGLHNTFTTTLVTDGGRYSRPIPLQLSDDGHNRLTALSFPDLPLSMLNEPHIFEMPLPADADGNQQVLVWETPLELPKTTSS